jgi:hypothetical protein
MILRSKCAILRRESANKLLIGLAELMLGSFSLEESLRVLGV